MCQTATRFAALSPAHVTRMCDCGKAIGPGNFTGLCWDCLAAQPAFCGDCGEPVEGVTAADEQGGTFICDRCVRDREVIEAWEEDQANREG